MAQTPTPAAQNKRPPPHGPYADLVRELQATAAEATVPEIHEVECHDGKGDVLKVPVAFLPAGNGELKAVDLLSVVRDGSALARELRLRDAPGPDARTGTAVHQALGSLIAHVNRFKGEGTAVWADPANRKLVAVIDYHPEGNERTAAWGRHRGTYGCPLSEAWRAWGGEAGLVLTQDQFAELLDARDAELVPGDFKTGPRMGKPAPTPADLVTLAQQLETYSTSTVKRDRSDGQRMKLTFTVEQGVGGTVSPPAGFLITIRVFEDEAPRVLEVRLRVTVEEGHAKFGLRIHAASEVLRESFAAVCARVQAQTDRPVFIGTPEL
jgi:hypothetical protein